MTTPALVHLDNALLAALRTATSRPIADGRFDDDDPVAAALASGDLTQIRAAAPWGILWTLDGGRRDGPMGDPHADAIVPYQATCVGGDRRQVRWMADLVTDAVATAAITIVDENAAEVLRVTYRELEGVGGPRPEGVLWNAVVPFRLHVTPA